MTAVARVSDELRAERAELTALLNRERRLPSTRDRDAAITTILTLLHDLEHRLADNTEPRL